MTEFDIEMACQRIADLYRERGVVQSHDQIQKRARWLVRTQEMSLGEAYEYIEQTLLSDNPRPERWE